MGKQTKCLEKTIGASIFIYPYFVQKIENVISKLVEKIIIIIIELGLFMENKKKKGS